MQQREVGFEWRLRQVMAAKGLFSTTDLQPLLVERGVNLSAAQVYRLVAQSPERLNMRVLVAVCDALDCTPNDLIEPTAATAQVQARVGGRPSGARSSGSRPTRVQVVPPPP